MSPLGTVPLGSSPLGGSGTDAAPRVLAFTASDTTAQAFTASRGLLIRNNGIEQ